MRASRRSVASRWMRLAILLPGLTSGAGAQSATPPYRDQTLSFGRRVADLVSRMTLEEKVSQMKDVAPAIPRLGVPAYNWWNEALHGVARSGLATVFPQAIGLAATWDDVAHVPHGDGDLRRGAREAPRVPAARQPAALPGAHLLVAEHQHLPRSALGARAGDVRRGSVPHRHARPCSSFAACRATIRSTSRPSRR